MSNQDIFIFEYISGGGFNKVNIPSSLLCEGFSMLRSLIMDFNQLSFDISTLIDERIQFLSSYLRTENIVTVKSTDSFNQRFSNMVKSSKLCLIIAPEFSNILYNLTEKALKSNCILLSQNLKLIEIGTSKIKNYNYFIKQKLPSPRTYKFDLYEDEIKIKLLIKDEMIRFPLIIKPEDGVGGEDIHIVKSNDSLNFIIKYLKEKKERSRYVIQNYVKGVDLSATLLGTANNKNKDSCYCKLLSINRQSVNFSQKRHNSEYLGGYTPYELGKPLKKKIYSYLEK
ncbi:MAG: ATP-grasp domain-containing protein, partial [Promethearchaeota archaeon]